MTCMFCGQPIYRYSANDMWRHTGSERIFCDSSGHRDPEHPRSIRRENGTIVPSANRSLPIAKPAA